MKRRLLAALAAAATLWPASGAVAHPHIWIEASVILHVEGGKITAVSHQWAFDPRFSLVLLDQFDKNKTRFFEKAELADLQANGFASLERLSYFTNVRVGGKFQKITKVRSFAAEVKGQKVVYTFTVALEAPIDPRTTNADFLFLDRTYYVDVAVDKVELRGDKGCKTAWKEDKENPIYYGLVIPKKVNVACAAG